jgi:hypothetical protein
MQHHHSIPVVQRYKNTCILYNTSDTHRNPVKIQICNSCAGVVDTYKHSVTNFRVISTLSVLVSE